MFRKAWDARYEQARTIHDAAKRQITSLYTETATLLDRIIGATNAQVIAAYEVKLADLEGRKARLIEKREAQAVPSGTFEEKLEPPLLFLSNALKLWKTGSVLLRRTVLKMAFADRIRHDRNQEARTPKLSFPFRI